MNENETRELMDYIIQYPSRLLVFEDFQEPLYQFKDIQVLYERNMKDLCPKSEKF